MGEQKNTVWVDVGDAWLSRSGKSMLFKINDVLFLIYRSDIEDVLDGKIQHGKVYRAEEVDVNATKVLAPSTE